MKLHKLAAALVVLAASFWLRVPNADAFCSEELGGCPAPMQCINAHCYPPDCIPPGQLDDVLYNTDCCTGRAVPGSTSCANPADYGTTWASCTQICA
jgi:hypothetical protein